IGSGHGTESGRVPLAASGLLGSARLRFLAAERVGLAMPFASGFVQALAEFEVLLFHLGKATNQAVVLALEGLMHLIQDSQAPAQLQKFAVTLLAPGTRGTTRGHKDLNELCSARGKLVIKVLQPRCIRIVGARSSWRVELEPATCQGKKQT